MASILLGEFTRARGEAATNGHGKTRPEPILTKLSKAAQAGARWAGRHSPRWERVRTAAYTWPAAGLFTWAGAQISPTLGAVVAGASLLVLEFLGRGEADQ